MKIRGVAAFIISIVIFVTLTACGLGKNSSSADWVSAFVVWDGMIYVLEDEYVLEVDEEIGKVTKYSDNEGTYSGNFSNEYEKGTKYYSISGIHTEEAIAVEDGNGRYRKAVMESEYGGN